MFLFTLGVKIFDKGYTHFLPEILELFKVLLILLLILDFGLDSW